MSQSHGPLRVVFFGDSICVGQGVSIHRGWVPRISALLEQMSHELGRDLVVVNASVNGNTTRQALERMPYDVQSHGVGVMLVQFGLNDCNYWMTDRGVPRVSPGAFEANLREIIERGFRFGASTVLLNTNHPTLRVLDPQPPGAPNYAESSRRYNEIVRRVAQTTPGRVVLNDVETAWASEVGESGLGAHLLEDGLHLSAVGHDLYFRTVSSSVVSAARHACADLASGAA
jgi:acyl-CoA thioesterase-1